MESIIWDLREKTWSNVNFKTLEKNWRPVEFNYDKKIVVPRTRGIYMFVLYAKKLGNIKPFVDLQTPIYIGHATNLRTRFSDHTKAGTDSNLRFRARSVIDFLSFWYLKLDGVTLEELKFHEQTLIDLFKGSLNKIDSVSKKNMEKIKLSGNIKLEKEANQEELNG